MPPIIDCALYDYVEIACMYHYEVEVLFSSGESLVGQASTIVNSPERQEFLVLKTQTQTEERVALDSIQRLRVLTPNARFSEVVFQEKKPK